MPPLIRSSTYNDFQTMNPLIKKLVKKIPGVVPAWRKYRQMMIPQLDQYSDLNRRSTEELFSIMRHEAHRIEKSMYNDIFLSKHDDYVAKRDRIVEALAILDERGIDTSQEPTIQWVREILEHFDQLEVFIEKNSRAPAEYAPENAPEFVAFVRRRRSCRVWNASQPPIKDLIEVGYQMIDAARWAPTSGNRQPWRFVFLNDPEKKELLRGLKEQHCISGPMLIFIGMDTRVYGALGESEASIYIDAGAAIMQMVLTAHECGLGVCWIHFASDLIDSRPQNRPVYDAFAAAMGIPSYVTPIAIVAFGRPDFIPPEPARTDINDLILSHNGNPWNPAVREPQHEKPSCTS